MRLKLILMLGLCSIAVASPLPTMKQLNTKITAIETNITTVSNEFSTAIQGLNSKVTDLDDGVANHLSDSKSHVTSLERDRWNAVTNTVAIIDGLVSKDLNFTGEVGFSNKVHVVDLVTSDGASIVDHIKDESIHLSILAVSNFLVTASTAGFDVDGVKYKLVVDNAVQSRSRKLLLNNNYSDIIEVYNSRNILFNKDHNTYYIDLNSNLLEFQSFDAYNVNNLTDGIYTWEVMVNSKRKELSVKVNEKSIYWIDGVTSLYTDEGQDGIHVFLVRLIKFHDTVRWQLSYQYTF